MARMDYGLTCRKEWYVKMNLGSWALSIRLRLRGGWTSQVKFKRVKQESKGRIGKSERESRRTGISERTVLTTRVMVFP